MEKEKAAVENYKEATGQKRRAMSLWKRLCFLGKDTEGAGVIEIVLILVVLIALVILFKEQIMDLADLIFGDIFTKAETVF